MKAPALYAIRIRPRVTVRTETATSAAAAAKIAAKYAALGFTVSVSARPEPRK